MNSRTIEAIAACTRTLGEASDADSSLLRSDAVTIGPLRAFADRAALRRRFHDDAIHAAHLLRTEVDDHCLDTDPLAFARETAEQHPLHLRDAADARSRLLVRQRGVLQLEFPPDFLRPLAIDNGQSLGSGEVGDVSHCGGGKCSRGGRRGEHGRAAAAGLEDVCEIAVDKR